MKSASSEMSEQEDDQKQRCKIPRRRKSLRYLEMFIDFSDKLWELEKSKQHYEDKQRVVDVLTEKERECSHKINPKIVCFEQIMGNDFASIFDKHALEVVANIQSHENLHGKNDCWCVEKDDLNERRVEFKKEADLQWDHHKLH